MSEIPKKIQRVRVQALEDILGEPMRVLDDGWAVVTPRRPDRSELIRRITLPPDDDDMMPPADSHSSLSDAEKALLTRWVEEGADYQPHWAARAELLARCGATDDARQAYARAIGLEREPAVRRYLQRRAAVLKD